jgi:DNA-directed RNA polymerase subunit M/transcription elongation factor TFIIS
MDPIAASVSYLETNGVPSDEAKTFVSLVQSIVSSTEQNKEDSDQGLKIILYEQCAAYSLAREEGLEEKIVNETKEVKIYHDSEFFLEAKNALKDKKSLIFENKIKEGAFTCKVCKSKKIVFQTVQDRSADEGSSNYMLCTNCGLRMRI